jgi:hypothetical protein
MEVGNPKLDKGNSNDDISIVPWNTEHGASGVAVLRPNKLKKNVQFNFISKIVKSISVCFPSPASI